MRLVAILSILSGQGSLVEMERFANRHRQTLNELLGSDFGKAPTSGSKPLLRYWMRAQPDVAELGTLVCDGNTLRDSIAETDLLVPRSSLSPPSASATA